MAFTCSAQPIALTLPTELWGQIVSDLVECEEPIRVRPPQNARRLAAPHNAHPTPFARQEQDVDALRLTCRALDAQVRARLVVGDVCEPRMQRMYARAQEETQRRAGEIVARIAYTRMLAGWSGHRGERSLTLYGPTQLLGEADLARFGAQLLEIWREGFSGRARCSIDTRTTAWPHTLTLGQAMDQRSQVRLLYRRLVLESMPYAQLNSLWLGSWLTSRFVKAFQRSMPAHLTHLGLQWPQCRNEGTQEQIAAFVVHQPHLLALDLQFSESYVLSFNHGKKSFEQTLNDLLDKFDMPRLEALSIGLDAASRLEYLAAPNNNRLTLRGHKVPRLKSLHINIKDWDFFCDHHYDVPRAPLMPLQLTQEGTRPRRPRTAVDLEAADGLNAYHTTRLRHIVVQVSNWPTDLRRFGVTFERRVGAQSQVVPQNQQVAVGWVRGTDDNEYDSAMFARLNAHRVAETPRAWADTQLARDAIEQHHPWALTFRVLGRTLRCEMPPAAAQGRIYVGWLQHATRSGPTGSGPQAPPAAPRPLGLPFAHND